MEVGVGGIAVGVKVAVGRGRVAVDVAVGLAVGIVQLLNIVISNVPRIIIFFIKFPFILIWYEYIVHFAAGNLKVSPFIEI